MEELKKLISYVQKIYEIANKKWENSVYYLPINMKVAKVKKFYNDVGFLSYVFNYRNFIDRFVTDFFKNIDCEYRNTVENRVKAINSIQSKINTYAIGKFECGEVSVNKCLNDIFGIRITLDDKIDYKDIKELVKAEFPILKCIESIHGDYYATHIYFGKGNNKRFQWELQIWNKSQAVTNLISHAKYKQEYAKWENQNIKR